MRRIVSLVVIFILFVSIVSLTKNIWDSHRKISSLGSVREEEKSLTEQNEKLKQDLEYRKSREFVEKEARNKLGLSKPGESIYVVEIGESENIEEGTEEEEDRPNWQSWLKLFFN